MKRCISRLWSPILILMLIVSVLSSCKTLDPTTLHNATQHYTTLHNSTRDTVYLRDSIYIRELQRGDTVYLTRIEWRDRWRTRVERDTVVDVRVEKEVVQLPPERYVPKFYKRCTWALWIIVALAIGLLGYKAMR